MTTPITLTAARRVAVAASLPIPSAAVWLPLDRTLGHGAAWGEPRRMAAIASAHPNALGRYVVAPSTAEAVRMAVQGGGLVLVVTEAAGMTLERERGLRADALAALTTPPTPPAP